MPCVITILSDANILFVRFVRTTIRKYLIHTRTDPGPIIEESGPRFFFERFSLASRCELVQKYFDGWQESKKLPCSYPTFRLVSSA